jgi:hypothetical protein
MGILDDAIREHLELKRQHGVPEEELQRQEEEALGPARREVATAEAQDGNGTSEAAEADAAESAGAVEGVDASAQESVADAPESQEPVEPAAVSEPAAPEPPEEVTAAEAPAPAEELGADHEDPVALGDTPPRGFEPVVEEEEPLEEEPLEEEPLGHPSPEDVAEDEPLERVDGEPDGTDPDLLEDTPEFLQETPEHDRLWFEQKPPRDFDFD